MTEWSPDARALIEQARKQGPRLLGPSAEERERLRAKLAPTWGTAPEPARAPFAWKRFALSSAALIAGLGWMCWLLFAPPESDAGAPQRPPAPQPTAAVAAAPSQEPVQPTAAEPSPDVDAAQLGHAAARKTASRERSRSAATARVEGPQENGPSGPKSAAHPSPPPTAAGPRETEPGADQAASAAPLADAHERVRASAPPTAAGTTPKAADRPPLTAASEGETRAVRTDSRPGPRSIEGELELLGDAQSALQAQRPSRALNLLQEHAFRFPAGALTEERMAMQALALCALDRKHAAASVLATLASRGSRSALLPRVRRQCGL